MAREIRTPLSEADLRSLRAGDEVLLTGVVYTARDAAHARFCEALARGEALPVDLRGQTLYYAGPTPTPPGKAIGAIGPTTSSRMDRYAVDLLRYGLRAMIGKGERSAEVKEAMATHGAVYFAAIGGCAAAGAACVRKCEVVAYADLGTESVKRLEVEGLAVVVAGDVYGGDGYRMGREAYVEMVAERGSSAGFAPKGDTSTNP